MLPIIGGTLLTLLVTGTLIVAGFEAYLSMVASYRRHLLDYPKPEPKPKTLVDPNELQECVNKGIDRYLSDNT